MARDKAIHAFYTSKAWRLLRLSLIAERGNHCERCENIVAKSIDLHGHHKVELTVENVNDATISLNPENILMICRDCHDKEHKRFAHQHNKEVFIVYGPPMSGKTSFVRERMMSGDLIIDMDSLYEAVSGLPRYNKPNRLFSNVIGVHNTLLDNIKTRYGKWGNAWIVGGYPDKYKRERLAEDLGAELIYCEASRDECLSRLEMDEERRYMKDEWASYIDKWFEQHSE